MYQSIIERCASEGSLQYLRGVLEHANRAYNNYEWGERVTKTGYREVLAFALTSLQRVREEQSAEVPLAVYQTLLRACSSNHGAAAMAPAVLAEMAAAGAPTTGLVTQGLQLRALGKMGQPEEVLNVLESLPELRQSQLLPAAMSALCDAECPDQATLPSPNAALPQEPNPKHSDLEALAIYHRLQRPGVSAGGVEEYRARVAAARIRSLTLSGHRAEAFEVRWGF